VTCLAVSPDGSTLASGSWDKTVRLWDWTSGKTTNVLRGHTDTVTALTFTPEGKTTISVGKQNANSDDEAIRIWSLSDQSVSKSRIIPQSSIAMDLAVNPDNQRAFVLSGRQSVHVLNITSHSFQIHQPCVTDAGA
jgi:hypothetical protein